MSFLVSAEKYDRWMGRFSSPLAVEFVDLVDPKPPQRVLDVGCGPGQMTQVLVDRLGANAVAAVDPSEPFVVALRERLPDVDAHVASAESLPYPDDRFDLALAQLVVQFMSDPVGAVREMARVTRAGGVIAASVWDFEGDRSPLSIFWGIVHDMDPSNSGEKHLLGVGDGQLMALFRDAGLTDVQQHVVTSRVSFDSFDELWEPYTYGVGPAGDYVARMSPNDRADLIDRFAAHFPTTPFTIEAAAWVAIGRVPA